jgi:hypothetical protein
MAKSFALTEFERGREMEKEGLRLQEQYREEALKDASENSYPGVKVITSTLLSFNTAKVIEFLKEQGVPAETIEGALKKTVVNSAMDKLVKQGLINFEEMVENVHFTVGSQKSLRIEKPKVANEDRNVNTDKYADSAVR